MKAGFLAHPCFSDFPAAIPGLLDVLLPVFEKDTGYFVKTISVGFGQAMKMGEKGEADVLLVHSPDAEKKMVEQGFAINRRLVMHNDFIIVGPPADPAKIKRVKSSKEAMNIAASNALFLSRADNSGTNALEKKLWKSIALNPEGQKWYQQTGLGMGETLNNTLRLQGMQFSTPFLGDVPDCIIIQSGNISVCAVPP